MIQLILLGRLKTKHWCLHTNFSLRGLPVFPDYTIRLFVLPNCLARSPKFDYFFPWAFLFSQTWCYPKVKIEILATYSKQWLSVFTCQAAATNQKSKYPRTYFSFSWNESQNSECLACFRFKTSYSNRKKYRWWEQTQHLLWQITHM